MNNSLQEMEWWIINFNKIIIKSFMMFQRSLIMMLKIIKKATIKMMNWSNINSNRILHRYKDKVKALTTIFNEIKSENNCYKIVLYFKL